MVDHFCLKPKRKSNPWRFPKDVPRFQNFCSNNLRPNYKRVKPIKRENTINSEAIKSRKNAILNVIKSHIYKVCIEKNICTFHCCFSDE